MAVSESIKGQKPSPLVEALKRRLTEGAGVLLVFGSLLLAVALASFDHNDPSPNHAIDGPVTNIAGPMGAAVADLLLQAGGLSAPLLPAGPRPPGVPPPPHPGGAPLSPRSRGLLPPPGLGPVPLTPIPPAPR